MPRASLEKYRKPQEAAFPWMLPAQSKMCYRCGKVTEGRHKGAHYHVAKPSEYHHIDEEGNAYTEAEMKERGLPYNVSHGFCDDCENVFAAENAMNEQRRKATRESLKQAEHTGAKAYWPVPEAHEPIPEAHEPIPEAHTPVSQPDAESKEG